MQPWWSVVWLWGFYWCGLPDHTLGERNVWELQLSFHKPVSESLRSDWSIALTHTASLLEYLKDFLAVLYFHCWAYKTSLMALLPPSYPWDYINTMTTQDAPPHIYNYTNKIPSTKTDLKCSKVPVLHQDVWITDSDAHARTHTNSTDISWPLAALSFLASPFILWL